MAHAKELKTAISPQKEEVITSLGSAYSEDFQQIHLVVILFDTNATDKQDLKSKIEAFNKERFANQFLSVGEIVYDRDNNQEAFFINHLNKIRSRAIQRYTRCNIKEYRLYADDDFNTFEISGDNFTKLFGTKNLKEYLSFNKKFYK